MGTGNDHPHGGLKLGYARVSTTKQSLERQLDALTAAGIPALLRERCVVEIGIRQAWPYVTFANHHDEATIPEVRLYIDSSFTVIPAPTDLGTGEEGDEQLWLLRLAEVLNLTVQDAAVDDNANLIVTFHGNVCLRVSGHGASWTTQDSWWLTASEFATTPV
jgi:hypothetical protein